MDEGPSHLPPPLAGIDYSGLAELLERVPSPDRHCVARIARRRSYRPPTPSSWIPEPPAERKLRSHAAVSSRDVSCNARVVVLSGDTNRGTRVRLELVAVVVERASLIYRLGRPLLIPLDTLIPAIHV
jgi:hypothetical protein